MLVGFGKSTSYSFSLNESRIQLSFDYQLFHGLRALNLHIFRLLFDNDGTDVHPRSLEDTKSSSSVFDTDKYVLTEFLLGFIDAFRINVEYFPAEYKDSEKNQYAAIKFILFHEFCHFLLRELNIEDSGNEEFLCDFFALTILKIGIIEKQIDAVEVCTGVASLFYLLQMNCLYHNSLKDIKQNVEYGFLIYQIEKYPSPTARFSFFLRNMLLKNSDLSNKYEDLWNRLSISLRDYVLMVLLKREKATGEFKSDNFEKIFSDRGLLTFTSGNKVYFGI